MAKRTIHSNSAINILDYTDSRRLDIYIASSSPMVQVYNPNDFTYSPDWTTSPLVLSATAFIDGVQIMSGALFQWYKKTPNDLSGTLIQGATNGTLTISSNALSDVDSITYICDVAYQGIFAQSQMTFCKIASGTNGSSVRILGNYDSQSSLESHHSSGEVGDAYIVNKDLYVWSTNQNSWVNVGDISGPAGKDAKNITLSGSGQLFRVNKLGRITPSTISVVGNAMNTSIVEWSYSTNGGQNYQNNAPFGVQRNGNNLVITGEELLSESLIIRASDGQTSGIFNINKVFDGVDGKQGISASTVNLSNNNLVFCANHEGVVSTTSIATSLIAYTGSEKVTPVIGEITNLPEGMDIDSIVANQEIVFIATTQNNTTLGSTNSISGTIGIQINSPINTMIYLNWAKINSGQPAKSIKINASSTEIIQNVDYVYLYPYMQNVTFNKWQYSNDGGVNWVDVVSEDGLSVGTYDFTRDVLRISKHNTVVSNYTIFKCLTNDINVYDTVAIHKQSTYVPQIQCGTINIVPSDPNASTTAQIEFQSEFTNIPVITVSPLVASLDNDIIIGVNEVTTTGAAIYVKSNNTNVITANWIAIC